MAKVGEGVADLVQAFDAKGRDQLASFEGGEGGTAVWWRGEGLWVGCLETGENVDLGICGSDSCVKLVHGMFQGERDRRLSCNGTWKRREELTLRIILI